MRCVNREKSGRRRKKRKAPNGGLRRPFAVGLFWAWSRAARSSVSDGSTGALVAASIPYVSRLLAY